MSRILALVCLVSLSVVPTARAAVIVVDTNEDGVTGPLCDLRDAITAANNDNPVGGCTEVDPSGADVIDLSDLTGVIELEGGVLPTFQSDVTLRGPGADLLVIDGLDTSAMVIVENGTLTVEGLTLANGSTGGRGGCIAVADASLVLRDSRVTGCAAANGGGIAIDDGSIARIERTLVDANTASNSGAGLIVAESLVAIDDSTFSGNVAQQVGGGIANFGADAGNVTSHTRIHSSTIIDNGGTSGGNLYTDDDPDVETFLTHVLLAAPKAGGNCGGGAVTSQGWNLSTDSTCALAETGDLPSTPADITTTFADNGGPTPTHALLAGSAAIDGGNPAGCTDAAGAPIAFDQRGPGFPRRTDGDLDGTYECDIGAFETAPEPFAALTGVASWMALACVRQRRRRGNAHASAAAPISSVAANA